MRYIAALIRRLPILTRLPFMLFRRFQARYTVGVAAVVLDQDDNVLLVEHAWHPRHPWGLPGGWIGEDEDPALALKRELTEELQLQVNIVKPLHISKPFHNHIDISFLCQPRGAVGQLSSELLDYRWAARGSLPEMHAFHKQSLAVAFAGCRRQNS